MVHTYFILAFYNVAFDFRRPGIRERQTERNTPREREHSKLYLVWVILAAQKDEMFQRVWQPIIIMCLSC